MLQFNCLLSKVDHNNILNNNDLITQQTDNLLFSQLLPENPGGHLHWLGETQVPPLRQSCSHIAVENI